MGVCAVAVLFVVVAVVVATQGVGAVSVLSVLPGGYTTKLTLRGEIAEYEPSGICGNNEALND